MTNRPHIPGLPPTINCNNPGWSLDSQGSAHLVTHTNSKQKTGLDWSGKDVGSCIYPIIICSVSYKASLLLNLYIATVYLWSSMHADSKPSSNYHLICASLHPSIIPSNAVTHCSHCITQGGLHWTESYTPFPPIL